MSDPSYRLPITTTKGKKMIFSVDSIPAPIFLESWDADYFAEVSEGRFSWDEAEGWWREA
jgi:hypothetical protein